MQTLIRRTPLIGRERELAVLLERVTATGAGAGGVVLLAGDAGIGKSRLVAEVKAHAAQRGFLILQGACFETDRSLPYAPLLDMLRGLLAGRPPGEVAALLGGAVPALLPLLPELALHLPDAAPAPALDPDQEKHRHVQALTQVVAGLAARQPVLVVVEDLHWGDEASLELLLSLARRLAARPVLLLLTYRGDEVQPGLASVLAELDRARLATEVRLRPLNAAEVEAMLRAIFAQERPVRAEFLAAIYELTEGNPFFVEEVLKSLVMAGDIFYADGRWDRKP